jgi:hypothetical protein
VTGRNDDGKGLSFLLCVEAGPLEPQSLLLVRSIRRWAGRYADAPIHAFRPREGPRLAAETYDAFDQLGVVVHEEVLNRDHHDYVHANTIYVLRRAEEILDQEVIAFCDSDKVFLSEPSAFGLQPGIDAAVTGPYYLSRAGYGGKSSGPGHPADPYWRRLYELAAASEEPYVTGLEDGKRMRAFWNGGLVVFRRSARLGRAWLELFERALDAGHIPEGGIQNLDELTLSALLAREPQTVLQLDPPYNYNLHRRARLPEPWRSLELDELVSIHYHSWFNHERLLDEIQPPFREDSERYRWLQEILPLTPTHSNPLPAPSESSRGPGKRVPLVHRLRRRLAAARR